MNIYDSIPALQGLLINPGRNGIGKLGEYLAARLLEKNGYTVSHASKGQRCGDLRVIDPDGQINRVEVKTARQSRCDGKWRFLLWKKKHQDYRHSDYVLLLAVTRSGDTVPFLIPTTEIDQRSIIIITSHPRRYSGKWAAYRQQSNNLTLEA